MPGLSEMADWVLSVTAGEATGVAIVHHRRTTRTRPPRPRQRRATVLTTNGDSYRLKAAQRNQTAHARQKKTR